MRYQGQTDIPLNAEGYRQAEIARDILKHLSISAIHTSSLSRATQTSDIINTELCVKLTTSDDLRECFYGTLEGQPKIDPDIDYKWRNGTTPKGAESYKDFSARIISALNTILKEDGPILIVAHRAVFWPIADVTGLNANEDIANACPIYLEPPVIKNASWRLSEINS